MKEAALSHRIGWNRLTVDDDRISMEEKLIPLTEGILKALERVHRVDLSSKPVSENSRED